ncbi:2OG-Fe(II) oxygenase [Marinobacteraceae bacterium S3BR75-40.1]
MLEHSLSPFDPWDASRDDWVAALTTRGWFCFDDLFTQQPDLLVALRQEARALTAAGGLLPAGIGRGADHQKTIAVRRDRIAWLDGFSEPQKHFMGLLEQLRQAANQSLFLGLKRFEAQYARFGAGDYYRKHLDSFRGRASRLLSLVVYLNEAWEPADGGQLRLYDPENQGRAVSTIEPLGGRAVVFLSEEIPHEVLEATAERFSIACWFRCDGEENIASMH